MGLHGHLTWITSLHPSCLTCACTCMTLSVITCQLGRGFNEVLWRLLYCTTDFSCVQIFHSIQDFTECVNQSLWSRQLPIEYYWLAMHAWSLSPQLLYGTTYLVHLPVGWTSNQGTSCHRKCHSNRYPTLFQMNLSHSLNRSSLSWVEMPHWITFTWRKKNMVPWDLQQYHLHVQMYMFTEPALVPVSYTHLTLPTNREV